MGTSLLLFTIGPVKKCIEPSRKLRDAYAGSFLLSHLSNSAVNHLKRPGVTIIFPSANQVSAPNRIVAEVTNDIGHVQLAKETVAHVQEKFITLSKDIFQKKQIDFTYDVEKQLADFLEIHWAYEEVTDFKTSYTALIHHMHTVKNTRMFSQITEHAARKCDLYAEYNALITSKDSRKKGLQAAPLKEGENLCAFAFIKRFLYTLELTNYDDHIESVAYMLLRSYLPRISLKELEELKDEGSEALFNLKSNQSIENGQYSPAVVTVAKKMYSEHKDSIGSPYYAIVKLDGDGVGQKYQATNTSCEAGQLSDEISEFAVAAKAIIEQQGGLCIFAGGEDILAFLPLGTLFETLKELVQQFAKIKGLDCKGTLSAGIIVVHLMEPLKPLLQKVESLEAHAKQIDDEKAAFSMEIVRRSSYSTPLRVKFGQDAKKLDLFIRTIDALQRQEHSTSFIQNVTEMFEPIKEITDEEMVAALLRKMLKNSLKNPQHIEEQLTIFMELHREVATTEEFIHFLQQLAFLAKETKETRT